MPSIGFHRDHSNVTIKTVETENEGLKRAFMLTIPAKDIEARVDQEGKRMGRSRLHFRFGAGRWNTVDLKANRNGSFRHRFTAMRQATVRTQASGSS